MNEIIESLYRRKSVRAYETREIPEEMKNLILESAMQAPSAGCQQLYTILDITNQELKEKLCVIIYFNESSGKQKERTDDIDER